ncbi:PREDICTED: tektin-1 [Ceratosolen solmsi marchali]|uniref:Tektin n=1 Tax=Ceratosolen solmsi marchali TaxID=326594 RepID=A0AAJ6VKF2_9HYME|nr:PREDICTED: tektin-1 [Ceratosolen solmsi marchali]
MVNTMKIDEIVKQQKSNSKVMKFTLDEWRHNNYLRFCCSEAQQELSRQILAKSEQVCASANETIKANKDGTNHYLAQKINDIKIYKEELICNRNELLLKLDTLSVYKNRVMQSLKLLRTNAMDSCNKCLIARDQRLGIDLVTDNIEKELRKECEVINYADLLISQLLEQIQEQIRCTKAILYKIDHDLEDKELNLLIDQHNSSLKESNLNLSIYEGQIPISTSSIAVEEWEKRTKNIINSSLKELKSAEAICFRADRELRKIIADLVNQKNRTDEALKNRIQETKEIKEKLEQRHSEIFSQLNKVTDKITELEIKISEKEKFIALTYTRLGNRCQRPNFERCYDLVEKSLINEVNDMRKVVAQLQQTLFEAQASLRFLLKMQIQLEEDINIKINSLKIDEVYCMTIHQNIDYLIF